MVVEEPNLALEANNLLGEQIKEILETKSDLISVKSKKSSSSTSRLEIKAKKSSSAEKKKSSIFGSSRSKSKKKSKKDKETPLTPVVEQPPVLLEPEGTPKTRKRSENTEKENSSEIKEEKTTLEPGQAERETKTISTATETIIIISNPNSTPKRRKKKDIFEPSSFDEKKISKSKSPSTKHKKRKKRSKSSVQLVECGDSTDSEEDFCGDFLMESLDEKKSDYVCLTESDIIAEQAREIEDVSDILSINPSIAIAILKYFKWNKDKLLTSYFDNPSKVLKESGINISDDNILEKKNNNQIEESMECSICGEECTSQDSHSIKPCYHRFCNICWNQYLTMKITEGQAAYINCPHYKCLSLVQEATVKLMVDEAIYRKYCMFLMKSFVEDNENVKWCPAPNCGNAITSDMVSQRKTVSCICSYRFCFQCSEEAHLPATCEQLKLWKKKCQDESETQNWIAANTQECPKCSLPTEKNGGCNHMTCRQCKYEYCWICLKDWKGHNDYYTCNRYQKKEEKSAKTKKGSKKERELQRIEMRRALEKYLHYYSRYMNHARSSELERIRDKAIRKMHEMQETEATSAEVLFIKQATDRLIECRSVLKYTYVLHYYMSESPQKDLFEYLQEDLEKTAELLSETLENPMKNKMNVVNLTVLAETRLNNLLDAVDNTESS